MSDVMFLRINTDKFEDINQKYKINCMPTFIFIRKKKIVSFHFHSNHILNYEVLIFDSIFCSCIGFLEPL